MNKYKIPSEVLDNKIKNENILYHYTSIKALYKIISGKTLWLTSLSSANDSKELYYTKSELIKSIDIIIENEKSSKFKDFLIHCQKNINNQDINIQNTKYYALSLTDKRNNLTHWRSYGNSCAGVCLAININVFETYAKIINNNLLSSIIQINHISYTDKEKINHIKNYLKDTYEFIINNKEIKDFQFNTNIFYSNIIPFIKTDFFYDEQEIRFLFNSFILDYSYKFPLLKKSIECLQSFNLIDTKFKDMGNEIRSYKELSLENLWCKSLFPEIILGPHSYQNLGELRDFLDYNGLTKTKISISDVPIR